MRISIIGLAGSGKSTAARKIAEMFSIPHIQIDRFWFEAGGRTGGHDTPNIEQVRADVREKTLVAIAAESWVSDGFYSRLQPDIASRADVVLFLDISLWRRLLNHAARILRRNNRHEEVGVWGDVALFVEIVRRTFTTGPQLREFAAQHRAKIVVLKSRKDIQHYLASLKAR